MARGAGIGAPLSCLCSARRSSPRAAASPTWACTGTPPLHLETLWIRGLTITTGLVDTFTTPRLLKLIAEGRLDATPFATHRFPLDETMAAYDTFAAAAETNALKVVLEATPVSEKQREVALVRAARSHPSAGAVDVILRDGSTLRLRAPAQDDAGALTAYFRVFPSGASTSASTGFAR